MIRDYIHAELGKEVHALSGYYTAVDEKSMPYNGREVLILLGEYATDGWCCGKSESSYAQVAGYIVNWKSKVDKDGSFISEVEPITDEKARRDLTDIIKGSEFVRIVEFL
ncbi:MAG: hypothetical protein WC562_09710 [Dehalococcoidia bacterium]